MEKSRARSDSYVAAFIMRLIVSVANHLDLTASIEQERLVMGHTRSPVQWLQHDVDGRNHEIQSVGSRVNAIRDDPNRLLGFAPAP